MYELRPAKGFIVFVNTTPSSALATTASQLPPWAAAMLVAMERAEREQRTLIWSCVSVSNFSRVDCYSVLPFKLSKRRHLPGWDQRVQHRAVAYFGPAVKAGRSNSFLKTTKNAASKKKRIVVVVSGGWVPGQQKVVPHAMVSQWCRNGVAMVSRSYLQCRGPIGKVGGGGTKHNVQDGTR